MCNFSQCATCDQILRVQNKRSPNIVITNPSWHSSALCIFICLNSLFWFSTDWLLAKDCLTCLRCSFNHRQVQHIWRSYPNGINIRRCSSLHPISCCACKSIIFNRALLSRWINIGTYLQDWLKAAVWKERRDSQSGSRVRLTHPTKTENSDTDIFFHFLTLPCAEVTGQRGSCTCSFHESLIQWCAGSSQKAILRSAAGPAITFRKYIGYSGEAIDGP